MFLLTADLQILVIYFHKKSVPVGTLFFYADIAMILVIAECFGQLRQCFGKLLIIRSDAMPFVGTHHEINACTHDCFHEDNNRLTFSGEAFSLFESGNHIVHIVSIHGEYFPAEGEELGIEVAEAHYFIGRTIDLLAVIIYGSDEVIDFVMGSEHDSFPILTFLEFTIAMEGVNDFAIVIEFFSEGGAAGNAEALTEGSGGHTNAGEVFMGGGVTLQAAVQFAESSQLRHREVSGTGEGAVEDGGNMSVGQEKQVLVFTVHFEGHGLVLHNLEIQGRKVVSTTERTARVAALYGMYHSNDVPPDLGGYIFQFWHDNWHFLTPQK